MKNYKKELWIGIVFLALSIAYFIGSFSIATYGGYGNQAVDSKFMPRVLGGLMAVLSILQILITVRKNRKALAEAQSRAPEPAAPAPEAPEEIVEETMEEITASNAENFDEDAIMKGSSTFSFCVIVVLLILYIALFKPLGFILSSIAFLLCSMTFLTPKTKRNWFWIIGISVVVPVAVYFLFVSGFKLKLPAGILNF